MHFVRAGAQTIPWVTIPTLLVASTLFTHPAMALDVHRPHVNVPRVQVNVPRVHPTPHVNLPRVHPTPHVNLPRAHATPSPKPGTAGWYSWQRQREKQQERNEVQRRLDHPKSFEQRMREKYPHGDYIRSVDKERKPLGEAFR